MPPEILSVALPPWRTGLLLLPSALAAGTALSVGPGTPVGRAWSMAQASSALVLATAAGAALTVPALGAGAGALVRADGAGAVVLLLVTFIAWLIVRYSRTYLDGEPGQPEYVRWLMATLSAVLLVIVSNHLLLLAVAWLGTSLALHHLLVFYRDRAVAVVAAHKKFIMARAAELCVFLAVGLIALTWGELRLDDLTHHGADGNPLPMAVELAIALIALAAVLKTAQLPFHGWLIQVMEAPTPVSALLHAGVVNLGGFVLLRLAPLVDAAPAARIVLVGFGTATAVLAALVMSTRISVKVALAWSTCAQMGFMLVECGLGLWHLALLHLVAHSLYKAHAFLASGGAVQRLVLQRLAPTQGRRHPWLTALGIAGLVLTYAAWEQVFRMLVPPAQVRTAVLLWAIAGSGLALLLLVQCVSAFAPGGSLARRLYPWIYGGLFLDEWVTRLALSVWPAPARAGAGR